MAVAPCAVNGDPLATCPLINETPEVLQTVARDVYLTFDPPTEVTDIPTEIKNALNNCDGISNCKLISLDISDSGISSSTTTDYIKYAVDTSETSQERSLLIQKEDPSEGQLDIFGIPENIKDSGIVPWTWTKPVILQQTFPGYDYLSGNVFNGSPFYISDGVKLTDCINTCSSSASCYGIGYLPNTRTCNMYNTPSTIENLNMDDNIVTYKKIFIMNRTFKTVSTVPDNQGSSCADIKACNQILQRSLNEFTDIIDTDTFKECSGCPRRIFSKPAIAVLYYKPELAIMYFNTVIDPMYIYYNYNSDYNFPVFETRPNSFYDSSGNQVPIQFKQICLNGGTLNPDGTTCTCPPEYRGDVCHICNLFYHWDISVSRCVLCPTNSYNGEWAKPTQYGGRSPSCECFPTTIWNGTICEACPQNTTPSNGSLAIPGIPSAKDTTFCMCVGIWDGTTCTPCPTNTNSNRPSVVSGVRAVSGTSGNTCACSPGYTGEYCDMCMTNYKWNGTSCVPCPSTSTISSSTASGNQQYCVCPSRTIWNGSSCVSCPPNSDAADITSQTAQGTGTGNSCLCSSNYSWNGTSCQICPANSTSDVTVRTASGSAKYCSCASNSVWNGSSCTACPNNMLGGGLASGVSPRNCECDAGQYLNTPTNTCYTCPTNSTSARGRNTSCTCLQGYRWNATTGACQTCPGGTNPYYLNSFNVAILASGTTSSDCRCINFASNVWNTNTNTCVLCPSMYSYVPPTGYSALDTVDKVCYCNQNYKWNGSSCVSCPSNSVAYNKLAYSVDGGGIQSENFCTCNSNYRWNGSSCVACGSNSSSALNTNHVATGSAQTCTCATNYYWNVDSNACVPCSACPANSTATGGCTGTSDRICTCNSPYVFNGVKKTCDACPSGSYYVYPSCVPCSACPANSTATGGCTGTSDRICTCNLGYTGADCSTRMCGAGYWYNSSIRGCSPCTTCSGGSSVTTACGVATDTVCGCPSNSSLQVDSGDGVRKCMCNIGYLWNTTSSSCAQCPSNTTTRGYSPMYSSGAACYCPVNSISNGTTCIACPSGSTATSSLVTLADTSQTCKCSTSDFTYNSVTNTCDCVTPGTYNNGGRCYYCAQCSSTTIARTFCSGSTNTSCESIPNTAACNNGRFYEFTNTSISVAPAGIYLPANISGILMTNLIYTGTIIRFVYSNVQYMMKVTSNEPVGSYTFFYGTYYTSYNTKLSSSLSIPTSLTSFEFLTCPSITFVQ